MLRECDTMTTMTQDVSPEKKYTMTTQEAADALGVSLTRIRQLIYQETLDAKKRGRDWFITEESVEEAKERPWGRPPKS